ncbi:MULTISPECIES: DUF378 domain-containing protein [Solibacillus]|uniref:DUF378 domain-containing protein n=1 Tax=Solibacillus merdavium TaxID=2762218 RepID=A0ABR8XQ95_9BACL|nr:DUF378 domain-containing protein [Solibacillus merdavium]MBD8034059.1 DUF378 domain-containing protein [Solibacillus merdavium]
MGILYRTALVLVIIGAINWGLIGFFQFDLVASLFGGQTSVLSRIVYALVGIAGLISIPILMKPLDDVEENSYNTSNRANTRPNYNMEAGKEEDFSEYKKTSDDTKAKHYSSNSDQKKKS